MVLLPALLTALTTSHGAHKCTYEKDSSRRGSDLMMTSASKVEECCDQCVQSWTGESGEPLRHTNGLADMFCNAGCVAFTFEPSSGVCYLETGDDKDHPPQKTDVPGSVSGIVIGKVVDLFCCTPVLTVFAVKGMRTYNRKQPQHQLHQQWLQFARH